MSAINYDSIVRLFDKYMAHKSTKVITELGFRKYLLKEQAFPAWLVKATMKHIKYDENLAYHLSTYIEDHLLTGMMIGTLKESGVKLLLKNHYGYEENPVKEIGTGKNKARTIRMIPATLEHKPKAKDD